LQLVINTAITASAVLLAALGFRLAYLTGRFFHFAHAITIPLGGYAGWVMVSALDPPFPLVVPLAALVTAVLGTLLFAAFLQPLLRRGAGPLVLLLASLAVQLVAQHALALAFGEDARALPAGDLPEVYALGSGNITSIQAALVGSAVVLSAGLWLVERRTLVGAMVTAVAEHGELSSVFGVPVARVRLGAFAVASALGGLLGVVVAADQSFSPDMGFHWLLPGVVAVLMGGIVGHWRVCAAALGVAVLRTTTIWYIGSAWQDVVLYVLLLGYFVLRPTGLAPAEELA